MHRLHQPDFNFSLCALRFDASLPRFTAIVLTLNLMKICWPSILTLKGKI